MSENCITIQRLRNLRPGEQMTAYRGDFVEDLSRQGAPKYKALLQRILNTMNALEHEGRIMVKVETEIIGTPPKSFVTIKRYTAVGIMGGL
jgi:hypothetical protein